MDKYKDAIVKANQETQNQSWLAEERAKGLKNFESLELPTLKHEEWKYTNLKPIKENNYELAAISEQQDSLANKYDNASADNISLVFVNGVLSKISGKIDGVEVLTISEASDSFVEEVKKHIDEFSSLPQDDYFIASNQATTSNGCFIFVGKGVAAEQSVEITYLTDTSNTSPISNIRNVIIAQEQSQLRVVERYMSTGGQHSFSNILNTISVAKHAHVDHYVYQNIGDADSIVANTYVQQKGESSYNNSVFTFRGQLIRNNLSIKLDGEHCEAFMNGLYMTAGETHVDNHTAVDHAFPNSYSNELYKGIMDDQSTAVFNGKIFVRKHAQKTNAFQSNKNILLSDDATINTKPQLEIWADDVKCSHGATTGALDEEPLFYLMARGISKDKAKGLLMFAFAFDVLERIKDESLKSQIEKAIAERLNYDLED